MSASDPVAPPAGVRTTAGAPSADATRVVLVRHGQATCNVDGVIGGRAGCRGLTATGRLQVTRLGDRLARTGELRDVAALYASVLPRAVETAAILAPALERWRSGGGERLAPREDCGLCELHPGEGDGLTWPAYEERFGIVDFDTAPDRPVAPGGESWNGFTERVAAALGALAATHPAELIVVACHAGVVEASLARFLEVQGGRLKLPTGHASMTEWRHDDGRWQLVCYNDTAHLVD